MHHDHGFLQNPCKTLKNENPKSNFNTKKILSKDFRFVTMKNGDNHEMERLETVGDSFLKLTVSIFTCRSPYAAHSPESLPGALDERDLTWSKITQTRNNF
jgi:dsRNA-specific ribonuclease